MSNKAMAWAFEAQICAGEKVVLLNLADRADREGRVKFSQLDLAAECNLSCKEVQSFVANLVKKKLIMLSPSVKSAAIMAEDSSIWCALLLINRPYYEVPNAL